MINLPRDECSSTTFFLLRQWKKKNYIKFFYHWKRDRQEAGDDIVSVGTITASDLYSAEPATTNVYL